MAKEYIEREAVRSESICRRCFHAYVCEQFNEHRDSNNQKCHFFNDHFVPAADVVEVPQEYACYTDFDDENYLVHLTVPISEKQFKALGEGADLWEVLRGGNDG